MKQKLMWKRWPKRQKVRAKGRWLEGQVLEARHALKTSSCLRCPYPWRIQFAKTCRRPLVWKSLRYVSPANSLWQVAERLIFSDSYNLFFDSVCIFERTHWWLKVCYAFENACISSYRDPVATSIILQTQSYFTLKSYCNSVCKLKNKRFPICHVQGFNVSRVSEKKTISVTSEFLPVFCFVLLIISHPLSSIIICFSPWPSST